MTEDPLVSQLTKRIITNATNLVGLVEVKENSHWDNPKTPFRDVDLDVWLRTWMGKVSGWEPGAPYCVAMDGAVVAASLYQLGLEYEKFLDHWTAGVMNNVEAMKKLNLLESKPSLASVWLAQHGDSWQGHAGIVLVPSIPNMTTIEGNTSAGPTADEASQRQGDGIWIRTFPTTGRGDLHTRGFMPVSSILALVTT